MYSLAQSNHLRYKGSTKMVFMLLLLSSLVFLVVLSFGKGGKVIFENVLENNYSMKQIQIMDWNLLNISSGGELSPLNDETIERISRIDHIRSFYVEYKISSEVSYFTFEGKKYNIYGEILGTDSKYDSFNFANVLEEDTINNQIIAGNDLNKNSIYEILIAEGVAKRLGYLDVAEIVGRTFTYNINGREYELVIGGVYNKLFGNDSYSNMNDADFIFNRPYWDSLLEDTLVSPIRFNYDLMVEIQNNDQEVSLIRSKICVDVDSIKNVSFVYYEIIKNTNNMVISELAFIQESILKVNELSNLIYFFICIMLIICFLTLVCAIIIKIRQQNRFIRLMMVLGYEKRHVSAVYFLDYLQVFIKAFISYTFISFILTLFMDVLTKKYYMEMTSITYNVFMLNFTNLLVYSFSIFIIYAIVSYIIISHTMLKIEREYANGKNI